MIFQEENLEKEPVESDKQQQGIAITEKPPNENQEEEEEKENEEEEEEEANENIDPQDVSAKPKVEIEPVSDLNTNNSQGLLRRLITCRCSRGKEIESEQLNELNLAEEMETKPEDLKKKQRILSKLVQFDKFLQQLTPWYMMLLYYLIFFSVLGLCLQLYLNNEQRLILEVFVGLFLFNHVVKLLFQSMLEDEWQDELPYLDTSFANKARTFFIYLIAFCNLDIIYWLKLVYHNNKRDSIIEHMFALCRLIDVITFNAPIMLISIYLQFCDTNQLQFPYIAVALLNMLMIVNAFMHLNFFDGSAIASIKWSFLYFCELYVRSILIVSCFVLLQNYNIAECMIGVLVFIAFFQVIFFLAYEGFFSMLFGFLFYLYKTLLIFKFREYNFGNKELDCDAQPAIVNQNKNVNQLSYSLIQQLLNLVLNTNLIFALLLFGAYPIIVNDEILFYSFAAGAVCYGIQACQNLHTLKQRLFYEEYFS